MPGRSRCVALVTAVALAALAAGCGSSGSGGTTTGGGATSGGATATSGGGGGKPAYCAPLAALRKDISNLNVSGGIDGVKQQLSAIQSDANRIVAAAKSDFPQQTSGIDDALTRLKSGVKQAGSSPSASQLAAVAGDVRDLGTAVGHFATSAKAKCG